ncbi:DUF3530 family protein [Pseudoalteromonas sp. MMG012]|uniref:DUF3530 family protein n=1 Tax=Pseudoalteromonas sp. MMG012 TaxID=2822686 RepID=UPI001B3A2223|nr:DUF3530 family protein [Pseudoalteromonas sp. MMG012]MBQ4849139.1 DUF3530 family protein [Pseudoalteromonas sp. MMG012]
MSQRIINLFLLICALVLCKSASSADFVIPEAKQEVEKRDLTKFIDENALIDIETSKGNSFAIYSPYMASTKRGIVILIPDIGHPPLSYNGFNYLHHALTDDGFDTYAIQIPDIAFNDTLPKDDASNSSNTETVSEESTEKKMQKPAKFLAERVPENSLDDYKTQLIDIFKALYSQLTMLEKEQLVVIAQGTSAGVFSEYLADLPNIKLDAFVAISAQLPNSSRQRHLPANLSVISPPLLDIFYTNDNPTVTRSMPERIRWVKRNSKFDYRQRQLFGLTTETRQHQRLRKEVDGFLRQL